jgi:hypothetical protein
VVSDFGTLEFAMDTGDALSEEVFAGCTVEDHKIVAPSGRRYALLVLPPDSTLMRPETAKKLKSLVADGASVLGPKPTGSPSLSDYPKCDDDVRAIASDLWGDAGAGVHERDYQKGKVFWNLPLADALAAIGIGADFRAPELPQGRIGEIHRRDGDTDIYFVAGIDNQACNIVASFRVTGKVPEMWYPEDGRREIAGCWKDDGGRTEIPLSIGPNESVFVIFRRPAGNADHVALLANGEESDARLVTDDVGKLHLVSTTPGNCELQYSSGRSQSMVVPNIQAPVQLAGKWQVHFPSGFGAEQTITLKNLQPWNSFDDPDVKYFSGSATCSQDFQISADFFGPNQRVVLDLGELADLASVNFNGQDLGVLWKAPFRVEVTQWLHPGGNHVEITVTDTWRNRLIGDEQQPADIQWGEPAIYNHKLPEGRPLAAFPEWLISGQPRPSGKRYTFTTWNYFDAKSPLEKSGLFGPVILRPEADIIVSDH